MKQGFVKVASATPRIRVADPVYNAQVICEQAKEAAEHGAKIVVFPELCITGYTCNDLFLQELFVWKSKRSISCCGKAIATANSSTQQISAKLEFVNYYSKFGDFKLPKITEGVSGSI